VVLDVCALVYFLYPNSTADASWPNLKQKLLGDISLLANLKKFDPSKVKKDAADRAKKRLDRIVKDSGKAPGAELHAYVAGKSGAAGGLFIYAECSLEYYDIYKLVEPLKKNAEGMRKAKDQGEKELAETEASLAELNKNLAELNAKMKVKKDELDELERVSNEMTRKLNAASQLITGLGSEQTRWTADMGLIKEDKLKLVGDCLTGSAFLSYCGPFNSILR
jgi:dynein heavy chain